MKSRFLAIFVAIFSCVLVAQIEELVIWDADRDAKAVLPSGDSKGLEQAPGNKPGLALKAVYPQFDGKIEWPAVRWKAPFITSLDIRDWDYFVFQAYNPLPEKVDLGVFINGKGKFNEHLLLQPNAWNHIAVPFKDWRDRLGDNITHFDLFMTRPDKTYTIHFKKIALKRGAMPPDHLLKNAKYTIADFENELPKTFERNAVEVQLDREWSATGTSSAKLTYATSQDSGSPWPSYQFMANADNILGLDWRAFASLEFTTFNPTTNMIPLKVYIADIYGKTITQECFLSPGQDNTWIIPLDKNNLELAAMRQVDFYLSNPGEQYSFSIDNICLKTQSNEELNEHLQASQRIKDDLQDMAPDLKNKYMDELEPKVQNFKKALEALKNNDITAGQLKQITTAADDIELWHKTHARELDLAKIASQTFKSYPDCKVGLAFADSMTKVMIQDLPLTNVAFAPKATLELARNEYESIQLVALGFEEPHEISVQVSELKNGNAVLATDDKTVSLVGHVKTEKPPYKAEYQGWWPDPLLHFQKQATVKPGEAVAFWLRFKTAEDQVPGDYQGTIIVRQDGNIVAQIPLVVTVWDFLIPTKSQLDVCTDFRNHIRQVWGNDLTTERYNEILVDAVDLFADYKIDHDNIYRVLPQDPQKLQLPIDLLKRQVEQGVLRSFNMFYLATPRDCDKLDDPRVQQVIDRAINCLNYWVPILEKEGLLKYAYVYCYDEIPKQLFPVMEKVCKAIKEKFPNMPISTTAYDHSFGTDSELADAIDVFTPLTARYDEHIAQKAREQGRKVDWYICIGPHNPHANWFVEYAAIEARLLMGMMTAKYRPDGFLYYAITRWPLNKGPITEGPYTNWNPASFQTANGDGSIFCAGPEGVIPTIRAENFRDGLEDYAYFLELENRIKKLDQGKQDAAKEALQVPDELVENLATYSRDPALLRQFRRQLAQAILQAK